MFRFFIFQFVFAIVLYLGIGGRRILVVIGIGLFLADAIQGQVGGSSFFIFALTGLIMAVVGKLLPLFKQQPFWWARIIWQIMAIIIYTLIRDNFNLNLVLANIAALLILNTVLLSLTTWLSIPSLTRRRNVDIIIS
jgi:hypothetical protein